ncbi:MAG TPA: phosphoglycolate phosphatase [Steroidobacteraceae bacterium]|nr:phosphoglycolate phosphatase [Steroidobacteraceae bacterium]
MSAPAIPARAVLFDLDGTLLDTAPDMAHALNALRLEHRLEPIAFQRIRGFVSHGGYALIALGFPEARESAREELRDRLLAIYRGRIAAETRLFAEMDVLLERLEASGIAWGIVTNKPGFLTAPLLEALGLAARAAVVVSGDTLPERKPHPRPLLHAASQIGIAPPECLFVGDAERDILAARAAGMRSLVARFGYFSADDRPQEWPADGWIDSPLQILEFIEPEALRA